MSELELKCWLKRAFYASKRIEVLEALIEQSRERAAGLSRSGVGAGHSDTNENMTETALVRLAELTERYEAEKCRLVSVSKEIADAIALLENDDLQSVLESRYLLFRTVEQTAEDMHYQPRTVRHKQKLAVEKLCRLLPCFAASGVVE